MTGKRGTSQAEASSDSESEAGDTAEAGARTSSSSKQQKAGAGGGTGARSKSGAGAGTSAGLGAGSAASKIFRPRPQFPPIGNTSIFVPTVSHLLDILHLSHLQRTGGAPCPGVTPRVTCLGGRGATSRRRRVPCSTTPRPPPAPRPATTPASGTPPGARRCCSWPASPPSHRPHMSTEGASWCLVLSHSSFLWCQVPG